MGKFVVHETKSGFRFNLKAGNGEIILVSEQYTTERACLNGIESVRKSSAPGRVEDQTVEGFKKEPNPAFEIYLDKAGEFRFRLRAGNGEIIGASESYKSKSGCKNGIESVIKNAADSEIEK